MGLAYTTTQSLSRSGSNVSEGEVHTTQFQNRNFTTWYSLMTYPEHPLSFLLEKEAYFSMQNAVNIF